MSSCYYFLYFFIIGTTFYRIYKIVSHIQFQFDEFIIAPKYDYFHRIISSVSNLNPPPTGQNQNVCQNQNV